MNRILAILLVIFALTLIPCLGKSQSDGPDDEDHVPGDDEIEADDPPVTSTTTSTPDPKINLEVKLLSSLYDIFKMMPKDEQIAEKKKLKELMDKINRLDSDDEDTGKDGNGMGGRDKTGKGVDTDNKNSENGDSEENDEGFNGKENKKHTGNQNKNGETKSTNENDEIENDENPSRNIDNVPHKEADNSNVKNKNKSTNNKGETAAVADDDDADDDDDEEISNNEHSNKPHGGKSDSTNKNKNAENFEDDGGTNGNVKPNKLHGQGGKDDNGERNSGVKPLDKKNYDSDNKNEENTNRNPNKEQYKDGAKSSNGKSSNKSPSKKVEATDHGYGESSNGDDRGEYPHASHGGKTQFKNANFEQNPKDQSNKIDSNDKNEYPNSLVYTAEDDKKVFESEHEAQGTRLGESSLPKKHFYQSTPFLFFLFCSIIAIFSVYFGYVSRRKVKAYFYRSLTNGRRTKDPKRSLEDAMPSFGNVKS